VIGGARFGHVEDVAVRKEYEGIGIGSKACKTCYLGGCKNGMYENCIILFGWGCCLIRFNRQ